MDSRTNIKYGFEGKAFWAIDLDRRIASYSYATSPNADKAWRMSEEKLEEFARKLLQKEYEFASSPHVERLFRQCLVIAYAAIA